MAKDQLGLEPTTQWGSPYYIPPASVPGGGDTTAKVYFTTKDLYYGGMAKSPELIMQIRTLKEPMKFEGNNALELVVGPGGKIDLGARVLPPPFLFNSRTSIVWNIASTAPAVADPGQVALDPIQNDYRGCLAVYTAPGVVSEDLIVTITAITHDPWFNLDPVLTWKVRVKKP
ncbi:MAG: hypothetical protein HYZ13_06120 [Acidobacteria bacterium]|nr:hypothetical protein [Acidobacteriota bacterium]